MGTFPRASLSVGQVLPIAVLSAVQSLDMTPGKSKKKDPHLLESCLNCPSRLTNLDEIFIYQQQSGLKLNFKTEEQEGYLLPAPSGHGHVLLDFGRFWCLTQCLVLSRHSVMFADRRSFPAEG